MTKCIKFILAAMALLLVAMPVEARKSRAKRAKTSQVAVVKPKQLSTRSFSVAGVSFDMLQFEGGKARVNGKVAPVDTFFLAAEPVSQQLWQAVMGDNPSRDVNPAMPVQNVSWNRYQQFIDKLNELTGANFRMPTVAEWYYAAVSVYPLSNGLESGWEWCSDMYKDGPNHIHCSAYRGTKKKPRWEISQSNADSDYGALNVYLRLAM